MNDSSKKSFNLLGIILTISLITGIMAFLSGILHLILPVRDPIFFGFIFLAVVTIGGKIIRNWLVKKTLLKHALLLTCIFWSLAWALYIQIQIVQ